MHAFYIGIYASGLQLFCRSVEGGQLFLYVGTVIKGIDAEPAAGYYGGHKNQCQYGFNYFFAKQYNDYYCGKCRNAYKRDVYKIGVQYITSFYRQQTSEDRSIISKIAAIIDFVSHSVPNCVYAHFLQSASGRKHHPANAAIINISALQKKYNTFLIVL
jgi:hypothetical protein